MNEKILEAVKEYLEAAMYRVGEDDALLRLFVLCNADNVCMVDVIAVEKAILRHFVKLYGTHGWDAYCNFRAA